jgi:hypothetical protein
MSFISALNQEIAETEADIAAKPDVRVVKLNELKRLRAAHYVAQGHPWNNSAAHVAPMAFGDIAKQLNPQPRTANADIFGDDGFHNVVSDSPRAPGRKRSPEREAALREAAEFLQGKSMPVKTAEIFEMLEFKNITVGGDDPKSNLSAMLSNSDAFISHGRAGWTLA